MADVPVSSLGSARRTWLWTPVVLYMLLIFGLSSIAETPTLPEGADKNVHAALYAGLGALLVRALAKGWRGRVTLAIAATATLAAAIYGVTDEIHQAFVPPRQPDVMDVVADAAGAAIAAGVLYACSIIRGRNGV